VLSVTALTQEQIDILQDYVDCLDDGTRQRGVQYFVKGQVKEVEPFKRGIGFRAQVKGSNLYNVKFRFVEDDWEAECSCPILCDCKHCCAVALQVIAEYNEANSPSEPLEDDPQPAKPADTPRAVVKRPADASVAVLFSDRLGRKLSADEMRAVQTVDKLFQWHRTSRYVTESMLEPIAGRAAGWGWNSVQIWQAEPRTPWETWLYIAAYLRRNNRSGPPALMEATDWTEAEALTASWERAQKVEEWRAWLKSAADRAQTASSEPAQLRVRLTEKGVQLEWRKPGAANFSAIKANAFAQLTAAAHQGQLPLDDPSLPIWSVFYTGFDSRPFRAYAEPDAARVLNQLLRLPGFEERVVGPTETPLKWAAEPLRWRIETGGAEKIDYRLALVLPDGSMPPPALTVIDGKPSLYVTSEAIFAGPPLGRLSPKEGAITIPAEALETSDGLTLLERLGTEPPPRIAGRVRTVRMRAVFRCEVQKNKHGPGESLTVGIRAEGDDATVHAHFQGSGWTMLKLPPDHAEFLTRYDTGFGGNAAGHLGRSPPQMAAPDRKELCRPICRMARRPPGRSHPRTGSTARLPTRRPRDCPGETGSRGSGHRLV
jgi:hypothetical protein